jgi:hypothetical protein
MPFYSRNRSRQLVLATLLCVVAATFTVKFAGAHGGGTPRITRAPAGPYLVFVWTSPDPWRVGSTHTTIAVTKPLDGGQETPVTGAKIDVAYTPVAAPDNAVHATAVEQEAGSVGFYEADGQLGSAGEWQVVVTVTGPEGSGSTEFSTAVLPADSFNWWLVGGAALLLIAGIGLIGTRRGRRSSPAERPPARATRS